MLFQVISSNYPEMLDLMCWLMLVTHGKYSWNEDEREPGECGSIGRGIRGTHGRISVRVLQILVWELCRAGLGCAKLSMEFPPVKAETTSTVFWKLRNRLWKIPEFQNSKIPLINSPSPEGAQMLYPNLTNLQAVEFPWSHIFPFQPGDPGSLSLGWSLLLILSLIPSSLELLSFHPKDFFVMQPSLDKEFKWISSKLSSNSLAGKAQLFPVVSSSTALEQDSGSIHQSSLPQGLPDRSSDPPAPVNGIVIAN